MGGKPPENLVRIAEKGYRPAFVAGGERCLEASGAYYAMLESAFPKLALGYLDLSFKQRDKVREMPHIGVFYPHGIYPAILQMTPKQQAAANELWRKVQEALEAAYDAGLKRGKSLLIQLADGGLTVKDFDSAREERPKEEE